MRFDMHVHTREGSPDGKAPLIKLAMHLRQQGFDGMLVTDHNSFSGFDTQEAEAFAAVPKFVVLRGVEYDTRDAGHILVILPDGVHHPMLSLRGMKLDRLTELVHSLGGILGPAHPYGTGFFALMHTRWVKQRRAVLAPFDFVETVNGCTAPEANTRAARLAQHFGKVCFGGSDAHRLEIVGCSYTDFTAQIHCNNDLIAAVKQGSGIMPGGHLPRFCTLGHGRVVKWLGITGYWLYNQSGAALKARARHKWY